MHLLVGDHERAWNKECVSDLRRLEKPLNFLSWKHVLELVLKCGLEIFERNWLELLFHFIVMIGIVASVFGMSFFSCVSGFRLTFSLIELWR